MNGVINIYKEAGYSSFHVVYELRKITGEEKVGHTGTLDPQVRGVLPICLGKATKLVGQLTDTDKDYRCTMLLGRSTDTQDAGGNILSQVDAAEIYERLLGKVSGFGESFSPVKYKPIAQEKIEKALQGFTGEIQQIPPMYSALKVGGMKLVNAARKGIEVERKPRTITIFSIDHIMVSDDLLHVDFLVKCSKGTYIRTLCQDVGEVLGIPCCMEDLERTYAAGLGIDGSITLEQAREYAASGTLDKYIIPADHFLQIYPSLVIREETSRKVLYGNYFRQQDLEELSTSGPIDGQIYRVYDAGGLFYALYRFDAKDRQFKCVKMFTDV